jgi:hypothetical protein
MKTNFGIFLAFSLIGLTNSCDSQELNYSLVTEYGEFKYSSNDTNTIKDLIVVCEKEIPGICNDLNIDFDNSVIIEIYPNQVKYNNSILNPDFINSPAISGNYKIQLVSPLAPLEAEKKIGTLKYSDKMYFLIHEYVHILLDKLEKAPPLCIDEGIASYYSSYNFYKDKGEKYIRQIGYIPTVEQLIDHYDKVPAPDLFSFILIDYIVQNQGMEKLEDIIRHPNTINQYNDYWIKYVKKKYY